MSSRVVRGHKQLVAAGALHLLLLLVILALRRRSVKLIVVLLFLCFPPSGSERSSSFFHWCPWICDIRNVKLIVSSIWSLVNFQDFDDSSA